MTFLVVAQKMMEITVKAYQVIKKVVKEGTKTVGRVYVPKEWVGKKVKIFLTEPEKREFRPE
jgi:putative transposon-encoded protein